MVLKEIPINMQHYPPVRCKTIAFRPITFETHHNHDKEMTAGYKETEI